MELSRRDLVKISAMGGVALALPISRAVGGELGLDGRIAQSRLPKPFTLPFRSPPVIAPVRSDGTTDYYHVSMEPGRAEYIPGLTTEIWGYNGIAPGPTFKASVGRKSVVRFVNNLPKQHPVLKYTPWTSVHLHGSSSLPQYDGYASDLTNPGYYKDYHYPNRQQARTLWYHDHGVHHTAENVFMGLAGVYLLGDARDAALPLPKGAYDVPLVVSDKMFNKDGSLLFFNNDGDGVYGDVITVNGVAWPLMKVARRKYRFRILNASPSRSYKWSLDNGAPMTVVATDAGLVPDAQTVTSFRQGVAERYEVVIDFASYQPGTRIVLRNSSPKNNIDFTNTDKVMAFDVTDAPFDSSNNSVPAQPFPGEPTMAVSESLSVRTRTFQFVRKHGNWTINGNTWDDVVASGFTKVLAAPRVDQVEVWEFVNDSGGWHHPVHVHFVDFKLLTRNGRPPMPHELGPKDVVFVGEGEKVRVLIKFEQGSGRYMMHCHNLVHEDHDMMGQFEILSPDGPGPDPFLDPERQLPEGPL